MASRLSGGATRLASGLALAAVAFLSACAPLGPDAGGLVPMPAGAIGPRGEPANAPRGTGQSLSLSGTIPPQIAALAPYARPRVAEATGSGVERDYAASILRELQPVSIRENREYCGYIGLDLVEAADAHAPTRWASKRGVCCRRSRAGMTVLASFHTHSTYSPLYASEFPTSQDMRSDATLGVDGYIATPGGRLWFVDTDTMTVRQLCGRGCLPQDPNYRAEDDGPLRPVFSFDELVRFENGLL